MPHRSQLIDALPNSTPFVGPETLERRIGRPFWLRLGANESPFGPSPKAVQAMVAQAATGQNYGDPEGWDLRIALATLHGVRPEEIVLASGIDELLALFCRAYADEDSRVVTTLGSYPTFEYAALPVVRSDRNIARRAYERNAVNLEGLAYQARYELARIVYVANPDNPSGSWHTADELTAFRHRLPESSLLLLDEAYADFAPAEALPPIDTSDPGVVRLRTFSKAHGMAGLRVGYAIGHSDTVRALDRIRMHFGVSSVAQAGALASLSDPDHVRRVVNETDRGRRRLAEIGAKLGMGHLPSATNFLLLDAGSDEAAVGLLGALLESRVFVRKPGLPPLDRYVRITIGRPEDLDVLEPILARCVEGLGSR